MNNNHLVRVLIVAGNMDVGGIENQLMHLVRNADKDRFHFSFTSNMPNAHYRQEIERLGCDFILFTDRSKEHPLKYVLSMLRIMKNGEYDIVHSHELFHSGITQTLAWLSGIPCRFTHAHSCYKGHSRNGTATILRKVYRIIMRFLIRCFSTRFLACSTEAGIFLFGPRVIKKKNYHRIVNSVDTQRFLINCGKSEADDFGDENWINILHIGRFAPEKNQLFLVSVADILKRSGEKIRILCAGPDNTSYADKVRKNIEERDLSEYMLLLGKRDDIDKLMHSSKVFLLPSAYEGMPLVMIEAQCSGLPCIAADTFSHEVDFGLGLITWMDPESSAQNWYDEILTALYKTAPPLPQIQKSVREGGFDSKLFADRICDLYEADFHLRQSKNSRI